MVSEVSGIHASPVSVGPSLPAGASTGIQSSGAVGQAQAPLTGPSADSMRLSALARAAGRGIPLNEAASMVRYADKVMAEVGQILGQMRESLGAIVKMYPPYPIDNPQRVEYLNKYTQLRHQIDALTIPPDNQRLGKLVADPARLPEAGDLHIPLMDGNKDTVVITARPVHTGEGGLNLPELPGNGSDEAVVAAAKRIDEAQYYVSGQRAKMAEELARYTGRINEDLANDQSLTGRRLLAGTPGYTVVPGTGRLDTI